MPSAQVEIVGEAFQLKYPTRNLVERLMAEQLASLRQSALVPRDIRNRLYELAHAIASGGEKATDHIGPLRDLMSREVESWLLLSG
jgi:hypothetical protein